MLFYFVNTFGRVFSTFFIMKGVSMATIDRIRALCAKNHTSIKALEKELGFSNGSLAKAATIKDDRLQRIAEYFNVSVDYLMTGEEASGYYLNEETAKMAQEMFEDPDMRSLFDMKRNMPPERFKAHMEFMKNLYEQEKGDNV